MGKDLHYTIRPFIERVLNNHNAIREIENIELEDFYAYCLKRNFGMSDVIVILNDDYTFNHYSYLTKPELLKQGGFFLVAKPEASCIERSEKEDKVVVCKIKWLLGAINREDFWTYEPPKKEDKK